MKKRMQEVFDTNAINNFTDTVGCVPRTHHLVGMIVDHALRVVTK
jgi:hypothetical protein